MNELIQLANPLLDFCKQIGFDKEWLIRQEELDEINYYDENFQREQLEKLTISQLLLLVQKYGDAFSGKFSFADDELIIDSTLNQRKVDDFKKVVSNTPTFEFRFKIDKNKLKQIIQEKFSILPSQVPFPHRTFLVFFAESLEKKFLPSSLEKIESTFWADEPASKVIVLVPEHEIYLHGAYLAILGGNKLQKLNAVLTSEIPDREKIESMYERSQRQLRWQGLNIKYLTPLHFKVKGEAAPNDSIARAIYLYLAKMLVIYTAEQTTIDNRQQYISTYSGEKQRKDINLSLDGIASLSNSEVINANSQLLDAVEWIYSSSKTEDALTLFQTVVARTLQLTESSDDTYRLLLIKADYLNNELKWLWKSFIEAKIDSYMNQVKALEDYVSTSIQVFADRVEATIKNLSDTMLAAVGVTLASFIAALFKDGFNPTVFRIGIIAYALYVLIFPLIYNMTYQEKYFKRLIRNFHRRQERFSMILDPAKVSEIVGEQLNESKHQFDRWFKIAKYTYILVILLALLAAFIIPDLMAQSTSLQKSLPLPSPTTSITPSPIK
ncbi:hypothetical protein [Chamaesiphon minutus]|uniref:Uncharacterized protein n=1 Tax=Chamaesiphon minutus (strain ATCC 27169 / PCC 6605) TaxID=1173020 RepID=K9UQ43_CHAP6|nr:hypothetical protein [Chamaesiphon minutus]AFY97197.1 hypothetical protein Cha6605_6376 [Chamaesiphon minutus PCC 6605]